MLNATSRGCQSRNRARSVRSTRRGVLFIRHRGGACQRHGPRPKVRKKLGLHLLQVGKLPTGRPWPYRSLRKLLVCWERLQGPCASVNRMTALLMQPQALPPPLLVLLVRKHRLPPSIRPQLEKVWSTLHHELQLLVGATLLLPLLLPDRGPSFLPLNPLLLFDHSLLQSTSLPPSPIELPTQTSSSESFMTGFEHLIASWLWPE